jgi:hypothetical protein
MRLRNQGMAVATAILLATSAMSASAQDAETPLYGQQLMTVQEQEQYREQIRTAANDEERNQIRTEHRNQMQTRAQERKVELPNVAAPGSGPKADGARGDGQQGPGRAIMTEEERARQRTKMQNATTKEERERVREENHERMKERAEEQGVTLPEKPLPRGSGMGQGGGAGGGAGGGRR